ncbi:MAG: hypothetical protein ACE5GX_14980 [Thermoanaerobaculia bacterium]
MRPAGHLGSWMPAAGALAAVWLAVASSTTGGASAVQNGHATLDQPPSIQVERIIATRADLGRGRWLRRLTGRSDPRLFVRPYGVAWDGDSLVVTDPGLGRVLSIDERGRVLSSAADLFESPIGVASCAAGLLVSDSRRGRVGILDRQLRLRRWLADGLLRPTGVACVDEHLFVVETGRHRVLSFDPEMRVFGRRGEAEGEFNFPTVLSADNEALWVGDTLNFRVQGLDPSSGESLATLGRLGDASGDMPRIKGIAIDPAGRLWISDAHLEQIAVYRRDGVFLTTLGTAGSEPGELSFPAGLCAHPDGRVAVADSLNRRVQILRVREQKAAGETR